MNATRPLTWFRGADAGLRALASAVFLINLGLILAIWWTGLGHITSFGSAAIALSHLGALIGTYLILIQLLLLARIDVLERAFGKDGLTRIHRINGYVAFYAILAHILFITIGYSFVYNTSYIPQFVDFITNYADVWKAAVAFGLLIAVVGLSVAAARKYLRYEYWYLIHLSAYAMVLLAFGHQIAVGPDFITHPWYARYWALLYGLTFGIIVIYRFATPIYNVWRHRFVVSQIVQDTPDSISIYVTGRELEDFKFEAGQFASWYFLSRGLWWQGHPFSFSAAPNGKYLRLTTKTLGDYSARLNQLQPGTRVIIDGPNGRFTPRTRSTNKLLMLAGGIGITPIRAMIEHLAVEGVSDMVLVYGARSTADITFRSELELAVAHYGIEVHYVLSDDPSQPKEYINAEVLTRLVPDFIGREVYLCGPPPMMEGVSQTLHAAGLPVRLIHSERFDFS